MTTVLHSAGRRLVANMHITLLHLSLALHSGLAVVVLQSGDRLSHPGDTVMLQCSVGPGFSMGSQTMYWYRQKHSGAPLEFLIKEYERTVGHFQSTIDTDKNNFTLLITGLFVNDSSTYYCAASHSDTHRPGSHTNTRRVSDRCCAAGRSCGLFGFEP